MAALAMLGIVSIAVGKEDMAGRILPMTRIVQFQASH